MHREFSEKFMVIGFYLDPGFYYIINPYSYYKSLCVYIINSQVAHLVKAFSLALRFNNPYC